MQQKLIFNSPEEELFYLRERNADLELENILLHQKIQDLQTPKVITFSTNSLDAETLKDLEFRMGL